MERFALPDLFLCSRAYKIFKPKSYYNEAFLVKLDRHLFLQTDYHTNKV